jgi:hypothetical protein
LGQGDAERHILQQALGITKYLPPQWEIHDSDWISQRSINYRSGKGTILQEDSANEQHIARFLPWEVSRLLLVYLVMVVPFQQQIDENFDTDRHLFPAPAKTNKRTLEDIDGKARMKATAMRMT